MAVLGASPGIAGAVVSPSSNSLDSWWPHSAAPGRADGVMRRPRDHTLPRCAAGPGLVLFRWEAPPLFATAEPFRNASSRPQTSRRAGTRRIVAAELDTSVDVMSADSRAELDETLRESSIELAFRDERSDEE